MPSVPAPPSHEAVYPGRLLALLFLLAAGCGSETPSQDVAVTWRMDPDPPRAGLTAVHVTLSDTSTGEPIEGADVDLEATMTHPGMRPEMAEAEEVSPGRYEADLNLTMGGDWVLILQAELPDGRTIRRQTELYGVAP